MKKGEIAILLFVFVLVLFLIIYKILITYFTNRLINEFSNKSKEFEKLIDSMIVKLLFDSYNREYMRLNYLIAFENNSIVQNQIRKFTSMRMSKQQRLALYKLIIQYYVTTDNENEVKKIQKEFNSFIDKSKMDESYKEVVDVELRIYFDKDISTIPYINNKLKNCNNAEKVAWNFKKAVVLKANNQLEQAKECMKIVIENTSNPDQKSAMQELFDNNLKDL